MFVWSAFVCFLLAYLVRMGRLWWLLRPLRFKFLPVAFSIVFSAAITIFTSVAWIGELSKWLFLGFVVSTWLMPAFVTIAYIRFFDFLVLGLGLVLFSSGMPLVLPWAAFAIFLAISVMVFLLVGNKYNERIAVYIQNRWHYVSFVKYLLPLLESKPSIIRLSLFRWRTVIYAALFSVLIWTLEAMGYYFLLSTVSYQNIREGVMQGILNNIVKLLWFCDFKLDRALVAIQQIRYESYEVPLFLAAVVFSILTVRLWVTPKKNPS